MVPVPETMENNSEKNSTKAEKRKIETDASPSEAKKANINNSAEIFNSTRFKFLLRNQETVRYGELKNTLSVLVIPHIFHGKIYCFKAKKCQF